MRSQAPSKRMVDLAHAVVEATDRDGRPPSRRQLADTLDVSLGRVQDLIREAHKRGLVAVAPGQARGLRVDRVRLRRLSKA